MLTPGRYRSLLTAGLSITLLVAAVGLRGPSAANAASVSKPPSEPTQSDSGAPAARAVFLIVVDTLRSDRLSCYGYEEHDTPNIDRLAAAGVRFTRAHTVAAWTCPSMGAMLTSKYPRQLGLLERATPSDKLFEWREHRVQRTLTLHPHAPTIAEMMQGAGFATAAFVNQPALNANASFARGFTAYFFPADTSTLGRFEPGKRARLGQKWETNKRSDVCDAMLVWRFDEWLSQNAARQPFVWLHLLSPHVPYNPPAQFAPAHAEGEMPSNSARYDGEIRSVDAMIGQVLDSIERHVGLADSLVIFTSDHGEEFDDHGHIGHGHSFYREVSRAPLLVVAPQRFKPATVDADVRIIDLVPTILELANVQPPRAARLEGISLVPVIDGQFSGQPIFAEGVLYGNTQHCVIKDGYKFIARVPERQFELYDVMADPFEQNNLADQQPERTAAMRQDWGQWRERISGGALSAAQDRAKQSAEETEAERKRMTEALRSLGYIDGNG